MKKNNLPKYWCVKNDESQLFKDTVIKYLNKNYNQDYSGKNYKYYGFDGNKDNNGTTFWYDIENFEKNPILLTLKEFIDLTTDFILPEKWCIEISEENQYLLNKFLHDNSKDYKGYHVNWEVEYEKNQKIYFYFPQESSNSHSSDNRNTDYTEITFEQFKKYVLNKNESNNTTCNLKLTKSQLIDLYNRFNCEKWKENIKEILSENLLTPDNQLIEIDEKYIKLGKLQGTKEQKEYLFNTYNIDLTVKPYITEFRKLFYEIMEGLIFHKTDNGYEYRNSKKEFMFEFDFKNNIFWYSGVYSIFVNKLGYNEQQINELLTIILKEDFKI